MGVVMPDYTALVRIAKHEKMWIWMLNAQRQRRT